MPSFQRSTRPAVRRALMTCGLMAVFASTELVAKTLSPGNRDCHPHCDTVWIDSLNELSGDGSGSLFGPIDSVQSDGLLGGDDFLTNPDDKVPETFVPGTPVETDVAPIISDE